MEAFTASFYPSSIQLGRNQIHHKFINNLPFTHPPISSFSLSRSNAPSLKLQATISTTDLVLDQETESGEKFDWYAQWYPVMPVCDLDKRAPHGKKVLGLDIVVWWDKNENEWKVFDDCCPHRLAPLSEGRIDQWGRLQCVYHGWCFGGAGDCKLIPQAPRDGPPIHMSKKACVPVYPSTVQNDIVWFWPNSGPSYKDILSRKQPPYIPELDDPSYARLMGNRDIQYGYEVLTENLMDPAHVPYAHYGIMGGGFSFIAPCIFYGHATVGGNKSKVSKESAETTKEQSAMPERRFLLIFICVPVSPGNSRLIWSFPRNFGVWIDQVVPRWMFHVGQNLILDSDLYLLHVEERKIMEAGSSNWHKACYVPTKSDALVVTFRRWLNKYARGQIDWGTKFSGALPTTPPKEQLLDRYWTHVVNCRSCSAAHKGLNALEVALQIIAIISVGVVAAAKQNMISAFTRNTLVIMAVLCFAASKLLAHFIYKNFHFHDYNHAFR
uniref:Rieske domain-containing protein n=1 Tax=Daucus carota subsp. sativus TaxID=79200 RepID=A0A175YG55_DAUCS